MDESREPEVPVNAVSESRSVMSNSLRPHGILTVHGILQARMLEWVTFPFSRGSSQPRSPGDSYGSPNARQV